MRFDSLAKTVRRAVVAVLALAAFGGAGAAWAHHSLTMFDRTREVTVQGTVSSWEWTNPHSWLEMKATEKGKQVDYSIESNSPNMLTRRGWTRKALQPGDVVTVVIWPYKNGDKGGLLRQVTLADGTVLST